MQIRYSTIRNTGFRIALAIAAALSLGGCSDEGPAIEANPQTISFSTPPPLPLGNTATVIAVANSGLAVRYSSTTPTVCSVESTTGVVTGKASGTCTVTANQSGNTHYAPAAQASQNIIFNLTQSISFSAPPALSQFDTATVSATTTSGLPISYSSLTPAVCSVNSSSGLVTALLAGDCSIAADTGSLHGTQTIAVSAASAPATLPGTPTGVTATAGTAANSVEVHIGATLSGGSPITGYTVTSTPSGITATGSTSPLTVSCPATCSGYAFSVTASNAIGVSTPSTRTDVITTYNVVETFYEPDTQPRDSIFIGSFTLNSTTGTVSGLHGILSESMTGSAVAYPNDTMNWLSLNNQLSAVPVTLDGVNGLLVTTFLLPTTNTFTFQYGGTDGWAPGTGFATYYGFPTAPNPKSGGVGNAYAMIFVNTSNPTAAATQAQIDKLAYADCAAGGMMSSVCMTGTTPAGYGSIGSMSGYPVSQIITKGIAE